MHPICFPQRKRVISIGLGITALFLLSLCLRTVVGTPAHASGGGSMVSAASANLQHSPVGTVDLSLDAATQTLTVKMNFVGLAPNSTHPAHIHVASCTDAGAGNIKYGLTDVSAGANGQATSITVLQNIPAIPATGWSIDVHNGPGLATEAQLTGIACASLTNPDGATSVSASFGPTADPNENATGSATLTAINNVLTVTLDVSGLVPNSSHAVHIHAGDCTDTGEVLYDLSPLVADANGHAVKVLIFKGVSAIPASGWDINVHYTTDLSTQTGYNPILCGNVVPD
jgi:hypothetical protein